MAYRSSILVLLALLLALGDAQTPAHSQGRIAVVLDRSLKNPDELVAWVAYGSFLAVHVNESADVPRNPGAYEASFEEEVLAREHQVKSWREILRTKEMRYLYMDDLMRVKDAGFMREYVWRYYRKPMWGEPTVELKLDDFTRWARDQLSGHVPYSGASIEFKQ